MSQTPPFTIYEPLRSLEKTPSLERQVKEMYNVIIPLQCESINNEYKFDDIQDLSNQIIHVKFRLDTREPIIDSILDMLKAFDARISALEKKEISER